MINRPKRKNQISSHESTTSKRAAKHSSSEPSTPTPKPPRLTSMASNESITGDLQNIFFRSRETFNVGNLPGRAPLNPMSIPTSSYTTLRSLAALSISTAEMKPNNLRAVTSPFTSMTTESVISDDGDASTLAVMDYPSPKEPMSPDNQEIEFECDSGDQSITLEIITSDDEIHTAHGSTKRRTSRSIFSSTPSPEPQLERSLPISIPQPAFKRSKSQ
jgi:hypothetical protein